MLWQTFPSSNLLPIAQLPRATYYYHAARLKRHIKYAKIREQITYIFHAHRERYGYRRITMELRNRCTVINHSVSYKEEKLKCPARTKKYCSYKGEFGKIAPNEKWVSDVTAFNLFVQKLYLLSPILDLHSPNTVSYTICERPVLSMVTGMLVGTYEQIPDGSKPILHSDQGQKCQHKRCLRMLNAKGIFQSMSRKGNPYDKAIVESFYRNLKKRACSGHSQ